MIKMVLIPFMPNTYMYMSILSEFLCFRKSFKLVYIKNKDWGRLLYYLKMKETQWNK